MHSLRYLLTSLNGFHNKRDNREHYENALSAITVKVMAVTDYVRNLTDGALVKI